MFSRFVSYIKRKTEELKIAKRGPALPPYSLLVEAGTRAVLAISDNIAAITFLNDSMMDTYHVTNITSPNHRYRLPFTLGQRSYAHWSWSINGRRFERTHHDVLTPELEAKSRLAVQKVRAVMQIMQVLSVARGRLTPGILLQETVYLTKKMQAHAFRDGGYAEQDIFQYPYVLHYADFADISFREAADDIILRAKLDDDLLAKTELLRLVYFRKLKDVREASELTPLLESFMREAFTNSYV